MECIYRVCCSGLNPCRLCVRSIQVTSIRARTCTSNPARRADNCQCQHTPSAQLEHLYYYMQDTFSNAVDALSATLISKMREKFGVRTLPPEALLRTSCVCLLTMPSVTLSRGEVCMSTLLRSLRTALCTALRWRFCRSRKRTQLRKRAFRRQQQRCIAFRRRPKM
jgi:hypothetical protein